MTGSAPYGMLDTRVVIDLPTIDPAKLPSAVAVSAIVLAELAHGVAVTADPAEMMVRAQRLADIEAEFAAIPFDREAARRYGTLVALTVRANQDPRPRRVDLMIAATAAAHDLPLYTRDPAHFVGLEAAVRVVAV